MTVWENATGEAAEAGNLNDIEARIEAALPAFNQRTWTQKTSATPLSAANLNALEQRGGVGISLWDTQSNPGAVTDWGAIINQYYDNGARHLVLRRGESANRSYPVTTPIAPGYQNEAREPLVLEGESGFVWQDNLQVGSYLLWNGGNSESLLKLDNTNAIQARDLGLEFVNGYTGRLVRSMPDDGLTDAGSPVYEGIPGSCLFERCYIGPNNPGGANENTPHCLVALNNAVEPRFVRTSFHGAQYGVRGIDSGSGFSTDAQFWDCTWTKQSAAPILNPHVNWRVYGGVFELTHASVETVVALDHTVSATYGGPSVEFYGVTFWDIANASFKLFKTATGRPINIKLIGGFCQGVPAHIEMLGGGTLDIDGLRWDSLDATWNFGSAATDPKRVRVRNVTPPAQKRIVRSNWDGHDITLENVGSGNSRPASIRQAAIEVGALATSDNGAERPALGTFATNVTGGVTTTSSDSMALVYLITSGTIAAGTELCTVTFSAALPHNKTFGQANGPTPAPVVQPIGFNYASDGVTTSYGDSALAQVGPKVVQNTVTNFKLVNAVQIPSGKTLGFLIKPGVLS